jgi:hypothetical protein
MPNIAFETQHHPYFSSEFFAVPTRYRPHNLPLFKPPVYSSSPREVQFVLSYWIALFLGATAQNEYPEDRTPSVQSDTNETLTRA